MKLKKFALAILLALGVIPAHAQLITTFGSSAASEGGWIYTPESSAISGNEGLGDVIFGLSENTGIFSGNTSISLTGSVVIAPSGSFYVILEDSLGNLAGAMFYWSSFTGGTKTVERALSFTTFNFGEVAGWTLASGAGLVPEPVQASFSGMSAVPEPSAAVLAGLAAICAVARWRRRG